MTATVTSAAASAAAGAVRPVRPDGRLRRVVDVVVAAVGLLAAAPAVAALAAVIKLTSRGPALFRQPRVGRDGREFEILKLRTMRAAADAGGAAVSGSSDPRVTRVGATLRRTRLDELPQLLNLLRGELTLVGPRPEVARFVTCYTERERELLSVRPGIIGAGALLFASGQAARLDDAADPERFYIDELLHPRLELDLGYATQRCLRRDLALIRRAVGFCLRQARPGRQPRADASGFWADSVRRTRKRKGQPP